jgi:UDP-glucose 4-epimerase
VDAIYKAATAANIGGETFQIATNRETTVMELTELLVEILRENEINDVEIIHGPKQVGDVQRNYSDTSKAKEQLNWSSEYSLETGLQETARWFLE